MTEPRFPCNVTSEGVIVPEQRERLARYLGKRVFVSVYRKQYFQRGERSNAYLWAGIYRAIADETGGDPMEIHYGLKREAVRVGVLDPQYILLGDKLFEAEPTTVVEQEQFSRYIDWIKQGCMYGDLMGMKIELPEGGE